MSEEYDKYDTFISEEGYLFRKRGKFLRKQLCYYSGNPFFECCDKCSLFGEPYNISDGFIAIDLCECSINIRKDKFKDERFV